LAPAQEPIFANEASKNGFASSAQSASSSPARRQADGYSPQAKFLLSF